MLDTLRLHSKLEPNRYFIDSLTNVRSEFGKDGFLRRITIKTNDESPSPFKLYLDKKFNVHKSYNQSIEINTSRLHSLANLHKLLEKLYINPSADDFLISRADFCVDIQHPFEDMIASVYKDYIRDQIVFTQKNGRPSSIVLGQAPFQYKIYNKYLESSQKAKKSSRFSSKVKPIDTTRFEVKITRKGNKRLPFRYLSTINELIDYDPFDNYLFKKFKRIEPSSPAKFIRSEVLKGLLSQSQFSSMQEVYFYARKTLKMRSNQYQELLEDYPIDDLYFIHREEFQKWLTKPYSPQDLGGFQL